MLHSRLGHYPMAWLDDALAAGRLAECWVHEACLVPASDSSWRPQRANHWAHRNAAKLQRDERAGRDALLGSIRDSGPRRAIDYARTDEASAASSPGW